MNDRNAQLDLRGIFVTLRRRAPVILAAIGIAFVAVYFLSNLRDEVYTSNSEVQFVGAPVLETDPNRDFKKGEISVGNELYLVTAPTMRSAVNADLGAAEAGLVRDVSAHQVPDTDVIRITVSSGSPSVARDAAQAYAENYLAIRRTDIEQGYRSEIEATRGQAERIGEQIDEIGNQIDEAQADTQLTERQRDSQIDELGQQRGGLITYKAELERTAILLEVTRADQGAGLQLVKDAGLPTLPDSPTPLRDAGLAAAVVALLGIGVAFLWEQLDTRLKTSQQVGEASGGVPVLAAVPLVNASRIPFINRRQRVRRLVDPTSPAAEAYRTLATSLRFSDLRREKRRVVVTSSLSGEGKTTLVANLAVVLAENGLRVLVVSADLRRPQLSSIFGVPETAKGITSVMLGDQRLTDVLFRVVSTETGSITVLPSGPLPHEPSVLLGSDAFGEILDQFEEAGIDFILIDCAPILPVSDPLVVSRHADGVILVCQHGKTKAAELAQSLERLRKVDAEVIGVVMNAVPAGTSEHSYLGAYGYAPHPRDTVTSASKAMGRPAPPPASGNGHGPAGDEARAPTA